MFDGRPNPMLEIEVEILRMEREKKGRGWEDATPQELLEARVQSLEEGLQHLMQCVYWALQSAGKRPSAPVRPEYVLDEEWGK